MSGHTQPQGPAWSGLVWQSVGQAWERALARTASVSVSPPPQSPVIVIVVAGIASAAGVSLHSQPSSVNCSPFSHPVIIIFRARIRPSLGLLQPSRGADQIRGMKQLLV